MLVLKVKDLHKEWDGVKLFEQVTFDVKAGERVALFGRNGVGKTTLLQGLLGRISLDGGRVTRLIPLDEWGWMDQQVQSARSLTALEFVQSGSPALFRLKHTLAQLERRMKETADAGGGQTGGENDDCKQPEPAGVRMNDRVETESAPDSGADPLAASEGDLETVMTQYNDAYAQYLQLDGYGWEVKVEKCLQQLKLEPSVWGQSFDRLSGGQKTRAQLAAMMVREPKLIVLDEPTNHLDAETLDWLEQWVRTYPGTVLYVSHDRTFIDRTATAIIELEPHGCRRYEGGYTDYRAQKELELRTQEALYRKQQQEREKLLESIRKYAQWFQQSHKAAGQNDFYRSKAKKNVSRMHAKEAALERLELNEVNKPRETAQLNMQLDSEAVGAAVLLRVEDASFAYEEGRSIFSQFSLTVNRGDRIAVIGPNGAGKSTLLKLVTGQLSPASGHVRTNPQLSVGYFAQELGNLEMEETILNSLLKLPDMTQSQARTILGCFLFSRDDVFKKIGHLSMGEKCRVAFLKLLFGRANMLVLDEPTNYLDIDTRERVEDALHHYPGTLLLVSHDRYLVRKTANRLVIMDGCHPPQAFPGTYDEYMSKDRSKPFTAEALRKENELGQLELRLARLIGSQEPEQPKERQELMKEIRQVRERIADLRREKNE
ncbi:ribosomal protection-like ABC-F family protein [Paenibacillus allorhizosphaerae]|uniref:Vitamin B12 import ATP-binding protein BtuD n=1 Tax=Paenibacillus allorhizosphaerae TaxID=2849866 RepID=A0ABN7TNI0_9BACL|nr:ABC-F type ribosomal protection protein [Paenibacillus allorhizosphaerae]CAG7635906.1 Vitamin B12 import ATP-binding protein BtuD [Paenibacillus allorhizosphaerae]